MLLLSALFMASYVVQQRKDFTQDFISTANGENGRVSTGYSFGNGINSIRAYGVYNGNIDLSSTRLELNNADVVIRGTIIFNSNDASIEQMLDNGRIIKILETDNIALE